MKILCDVIYIWNDETVEEEKENEEGRRRRFMRGMLHDYRQ